MLERYTYRKRFLDMLPKIVSPSFAEKMRKVVEEERAKTLAEKPIIVAVDGAHASGKTVHADLIREVLGRGRTVFVSRGEITDALMEEFKEALRRDGIRIPEGEDENVFVGKLLREKMPEKSVEIDKKALEILMKAVFEGIRNNKHVIIEGDGVGALVEWMREMGMITRDVRVVKVWLGTERKEAEKIMRFRGEKPDFQKLLRRYREDLQRYRERSRDRSLPEFLRVVYREEAKKIERILQAYEREEAPKMEGYDLFHHPRPPESLIEFVRLVGKVLRS